MRPKHEVRAYMHEVVPWRVEDLRKFIRLLPEWSESHDSPLRLLDRELLAVGTYTKVLEDHLLRAQQEVTRLQGTLRAAGAIE